MNDDDFLTKYIGDERALRGFYQLKSDIINVSNLALTTTLEFTGHDHVRGICKAELERRAYEKRLKSFERQNSILEKQVNSAANSARAARWSAIATIGIFLVGCIQVWFMLHEIMEF